MYKIERPAKLCVRGCPAYGGTLKIVTSLRSDNFGEESPGTLPRFGGAQVAANRRHP